MRIRFANHLALAVLAAGLAVGPAAHRLQHGVEYAEAAGGSPAEVYTHVPVPALHRSVPANTVDETICILCQVLDAQIVLEPSEWHTADLRTFLAAEDPSLVSGSLAHRPRGRAPPATA